MNTHPLIALSDPVQVAIIATVGPTLIGLLGLVNQIYLSRKAEEARAKIHAAVEVQSDNIQKIEKATNSMKDALVKATGEARLAEGIAEGIKQAEAKAAMPKGHEHDP